MRLAEFLLARIAEDEDIARGAYRDSIDDNGVCHSDWTPAAEAVMWGDATMVTGLEPGYLAEHIARHDPARILAECEAKRRIVEYQACDEPTYEMRLLAAVYADHPDCREDWRR